MNDYYRLQGCLSPLLDGTVVRLLGPYPAMRIFAKESWGKQFVEVEIDGRRTFADKSRLVRA